MAVVQQNSSLMKKATPEKLQAVARLAEQGLHIATRWPMSETLTARPGLVN
ncbi:hypothetical protein GCM10027578_07180 [Spirosoma luteolum]